MPKPAVPTGLGKQAQAQWRKIVDEFELRLDELRVLEDACREIDLVERIDKELKSSPLMVPGSKNQLVVSPLVREVRQHRLTVARLLGSLNLPDDDEEERGEEEPKKGERSTQARAAAAARWSSGT